MVKGLLVNDLKKNKAINLVLCLFILLATMLVSGGVGIIAETVGSMNGFFEKAQPLHYLQMATGEVDHQAVADFAGSQKNVAAYQVLEQIGVDNSNLYYGNSEEADASSVMENSFTTQNSEFDFLLDENNQVCEVKSGEVGLPVFTMEEYGLKVGDKLRIRRGDFYMEFTIAHQIKDSQMNPSLVSSKRFLVSEEDYQTIAQEFGQPETLIEFRLKDYSKLSEFEHQYNQSGLPNELSITYSIIQLMNALTTGFTVLILVFASLLLLLIAGVCLRYTILAALEEEYKEIGMLKAIGIPYRQILKLYRRKYVIIAGISCGAGLLLGMIFTQQFTQEINAYMGSSSTIMSRFLFSLVSGILVFLLIYCMCTLFLRRLKKITPVDAIRGVAGKRKKVGNRFTIQRKWFPWLNLQLGIRDVLLRFRTYFILFFTFVLATFLMIVPVNLYTTISDPGFSKYMGVGEADILVTLRYTEDISQRYEQMMERLENDSDVKSAAEKITGAYLIKNADGKFDAMNIDTGDPKNFDVDYLEGTYPKKENEVALSLLNANALEKKLGETLELKTSTGIQKLTIVGIYQDITNGGKTAKGILSAQPESVTWYAAAAVVKEGVSVEDKVAEWGKEFYPAKVSSIAEQMDQTFGSTIQQVSNITIACAAISCIILVLITALFFRLLLTKDKQEIIIQKGLGFTSKRLQNRYILAASFLLVIGVGSGLILANTVGEVLVGMIMSNMGASQIAFTLQPLLTYLACPLLLVTVELITLYFATRSISKADNYLIIE